ncbi:hypothetical protein [Microbacterium terrisoli]|uniref:hypothetical protein n=1 Tax=Microbacterium terrisoli TaxID=3242192 RepID=UPI00280382C3|nr:hypothetical protein [Microbacterium protaetiae]
MFIIVVLAGLAIWGLVATVIELRRDGYRAVPTNETRVAEYGPPEDSSAGSAPRQSIVAASGRVAHHRPQAVPR